MGSDIDSVYLNYELPVVCNKECISDMSCGLLMIPDHTFPGYAKLQLICDGKLLFKKDLHALAVLRIQTILANNKYLKIQLDRQNRICLMTNYQSEHLNALGLNRHGPALQLTKGEIFDFIQALECDTWPLFATEWLTRRRDNGWPSSYLIQKIKHYVFFVVHASHPQSNEKELQWRLSFTRQERSLVVHFNSVQIKCYVVLKAIKNNINEQIGEETLTSYHCKTCMFYMLENTPNEMWIPENLASCVLMCLRQIRLWAMNGNCPNYFIPGENMFERITNTIFKRKLFDILDKVVIFDFEKLTLIRDSNGNLLAAKNNSLEFFKASIDIKGTDEDIRKHHKLKGIVNLTTATAVMRNQILKRQYSRNIEQFIENIKMLMSNLLRANTIFDHTIEVTKNAESLIMPFLELSVLSNTVVKQLCDGNYEFRTTLKSRQWNKLECTGVSKLKQAAIFLAVNENAASLQTLFKASQRSKVPFCVCDLHNPVLPGKAALLNITGYALKEAVTYLLKHTLLPCVSFLPTEQLITPMAIRYEMIRCFGIPKIEREMVVHYRFGWGMVDWLDWGMVDGTFLTIFLLYLNHIALDQTPDARKSIKKMILLLNKGSISHRETCLNLLGWIHMETGNVRLAVQCFAKSLKERPTYNAAYWHFCFIVCSKKQAVCY